MSDFISYSRRDAAFMRRIHESLSATGRDIWVDFEDIPPTADWWDEIRTGIETAANFIFIISPDSIQSEVCHREINHAVQHNKRLVPLLHRDLIEEADKERLPDVIGSHNWIFFRDGDDYDTALEKLLAALRGGVKTVMIPQDNMKDLRDIPDNVKRKMDIVPVSNCDEVLARALVNELTPIEWNESDEEACPNTSA